MGVMSDGEISLNFAVVPFPTGPSNTSGNVGMGIWDNGLVFPHNSNWNLAELLMVIEEYWTWHQGYEGLMLEASMDWLMPAIPSDEDLHRILHVGRNSNFCISWTILELSFVYGTFTDYFLHGTRTVQQAVDAHMASQQEILDNFFGR